DIEGVVLCVVWPRSLEPRHRPATVRSWGYPARLPPGSPAHMAGFLLLRIGEDARIPPSARPASCRDGPPPRGCVLPAGGCINRKPHQSASSSRTRRGTQAGFVL